MSGIAEFFSTAQGFFASALGTGALTLLLGSPKHCSILLDGKWVDCRSHSACTSESVSHGFASIRCTNLIGLDAVADQTSTAAVAALVVGVICGAVAHFAADLAKAPPA